MTENNKRFPVLLLDYDGTMAETQPAIIEAIKCSLEKMKKTYSQDIIMDNLGHGGTLLEFYKRLAPGCSEKEAEEFVAYYRSFYDDADERKTFLYPHIVETIKELVKNGYKMIIISNKHEPTLIKSVRRFGLDQYISIFLGARPDKPRKPQKEVWDVRIKPALEKLGEGHLSPSDLLLVGDTSADMKFGEAMGIDVCWVSYGHGSIEDYKHYHPSYRIDHFADILILLDHINKKKI